MLNFRFSTLAFGFGILDFGLWNSGQGFRIAQSPKSLDFALLAWDLGLWVMDFAFSVLGFGLWALGFGFKILDSRYCTLDFGLWTLGFGFKILDFRFLVLGFQIWEHFGFWT